MSSSLAENWMHDVETRLSSRGFMISHDVAYEGDRFQAVAHRSRVELSTFGNCERFFVFADFNTLSEASMRQFSANAFRYAIASKKVPLPRGMFESVWCFAVATVEVLDQATADSVRYQVPPKHWAAVEFPVVYERGKGELCFFEGTPAWGAVYYTSFRKQIRQLLQTR